MKKTVALAVIAVVAVSALSVWLLYPRDTADTDASFSDDFEEGLNGWTPDAHVPEDPNNPGNPVAWEIDVSSNQSVSGSQSVRFMIDGLQDDGAIWIERKLSLEPNSVKNVNVTFQFWSPSESFNTIAVVVGYIGDKDPAVEEDFQVIDPANMAEGWKTYSFDSEVTVDNNGDAYVGVGIAVRWETVMEYFIDDITVEVN